MGLTRQIGRESRRRRRPTLDALENRTLLSTVAAPPALSAPFPAATTSVPSNATNFDKIVGASATRAQYGVDGRGYAVAVIDTGVNYNHEDLGSGFGPGHKVVAGYDFSTNSPDPNAATWQHGTAVAGLIAGSDPSTPGIAPGADIVALRVFGNDNQGDFNRVADALQWVVDHHGENNITVVNLSLSDGNNYTRNWFANDGGVGQRITELIRKLSDLNIPVVTATGNSFQKFQGVGFTAIVGDTISVTATDATDHILAGAQRLGKSEGGGLATDLAAPGQSLYAPIQGNDFATVDGTSFAAPLVSGSLVLLQQIYQSRFGHLPSVNDLDAWLQSGAKTVHDDVTGIDIGRLDVVKSAGLIPTPPASKPSSLPPTGTTDSPPTASTPASNDSSGALTEMFFNGKSVGKASTSSIGNAWANFFSLFTGRLTSIRGWGKASATPSPQGATLTKIQGWSATQSTATPVPAGTIALTVKGPHSGFAVHRRHR